MKVKFWIISLIALVMLLIIPVQAYTLINDYTMVDDPSNSAGVSTFDTVYQQFNANITKIVGSFPCRPTDLKGHAISGTVSGTLNKFESAYPVRGNMTMTYDFGVLNEWHTCSIEVKVLDIALDSNDVTLYPQNIRFSTWMTLYVNQSSSSPPSVNFAHWTGRAGTWQIYTGSEYNPPVASFTATPDSGFPPLTVAFNDTSTVGTNPITSWLWDFNDFATSTHPNNASHQYILNGTYNATLTVSDGISNSTAYKNITIGTPPAIPGSYNLFVHVKDSAGVHIEGAHISLLVSNGTVLTNYTNSVGISNFIAVPGSAAAIIDVTKTGYPEYIETFTIASSFTKEVTLGATGIKLYVDVKDSIYGSILDNVNIGIKNTTSGVWRNASGHSGSIYYDSTGASYEYPLAIGQTVVVAASKAGYLSDWESVTIPSDEYTVTLQLVNINGSAPSSGNFTAVIAARSMTTGLEIPGASITINELGRMAATNGAGVAMFYNVPVGSYSLMASATGYNPATSDITGANQETVMKSINMLPTGYHQNENGTILDPDGNPFRPWDPDYGDGEGNWVPGGGSGNITAAAANERAAAGITSFLDNIVEIGEFVLLLIIVWFIIKIFR